MATGEHNGAAARDLILDECRSLNAGDRAVFYNEMFHAAWPPTGEFDGRPTALGVSVGEFKSIAAAHSGNRPIGGTSSIEALRAELGAAYSVEDLPGELAIVVRRLVAGAGLEPA